MSPTTIALIIGLVEEAISAYPTIAAEISTIFANGNPSPADWEALRVKVLAQSFAQLAPDAPTQ